MSLNISSNDLTGLDCANILKETLLTSNLQELVLSNNNLSDKGLISLSNIFAMTVEN